MVRSPCSQRTHGDDPRTTGTRPAHRGSGRPRSADDVAFHKILVKPDLEKYDDDDLDYLEVWVVYEGEREQLRPGRTVDLVVALRRRLYDEGITEFPVPYMAKKSEWEEHPDPA